jgi:hypothetical protein
MLGNEPQVEDAMEINPDKVRQVITGARILDAKEEVCDVESGSNGSDDGMIDILEDNVDDATGQELAEFIRSLDDEEQAELVALAWVGRGTYDADQFGEAVDEATRVHNNRTAEYLIGLPLLGDYLEEGLSAVEELERAREGRE